MTPTPGAQGRPRAGGLSKQRAAELTRRLRELHHARLVAQVESRHYLITGSSRDVPGITTPRPRNRDRKAGE